MLPLKIMKIFFSIWYDVIYHWEKSQFISGLLETEAEEHKFC